jgi:hypothetical protein
VSVVPTDECCHKIGDEVRLANPYAEEDPRQTYFVIGIRWNHQRERVDFGWDITIASASEIQNQYGATDGFAPDDLLSAKGGET